MKRPDALARRQEAERTIARWVYGYWGVRQTAAVLRHYTATARVTSQQVSRWAFHRSRMTPRSVAALLAVAPYVERRRQKEEAVSGHRLDGTWEKWPGKVGDRAPEGWSLGRLP